MLLAFLYDSLWFLKVVMFNQYYNDVPVKQRLLSADLLGRYEIG